MLRKVDHTPTAVYPIRLSVTGRFFVSRPKPRVTQHDHGDVDDADTAYANHDDVESTQATRASPNGVDDVNAGVNVGAISRPWPYSCDKVTISFWLLAGKCDDGVKYFFHSAESITINPAFVSTSIFFL